MTPHPQFTPTNAELTEAARYAARRDIRRPPTKRQVRAREPRKRASVERKERPAS